MDEKSAKAQAERIALAIEEDHRQAEHYLLSYARERKDYAKRRAEYVYKTTAGHDPRPSAAGSAPCSGLPAQASRACSKTPAAD